MTKSKVLNKEQLLAIKHKGGPLLIIAGAGTGKTTVITERIKHLIIERKVPPSNILALTFTEKAAKEMEDRVYEILPYGLLEMWILTFHSFCDRVLRREGLHIGLDPKYKLMSEADAISLVRKNLFKFDLDYFRPLGNPNKFISGLLDHFSRLADEDVLPSQYSDWANSKFKSQKSKLAEEEKMERKKWKELAGAYKTYQDLKVEAGVLDFGDLIIKTLEVFRRRPNVLLQYRKQFKHILVDEFQDTNIAQNELAKLLAGKGGNITVVADDDQSIYRWRGAAVSNVLQFKKTYPKAKIITLTKNYRSDQRILDSAYRLIQNNNPDRLEYSEKVNKRLVSQIKDNSNSQAIKFIHSSRLDQEAEAVAVEIKKLADTYPYSDIAILVRANNHAEAFLKSLGRHGIPAQFLGPGKLFKEAEIVDLISYLKVLVNFEDSISFLRLLSMDALEIANMDLIRVANFAKRQNLSLFDACKHLDKISVSKEGREKIIKVINQAKKAIGQTKNKSAGELLYSFLSDLALLPKLLNPDSEAAQNRAQNIGRFFEKLKEYEMGHEDAGVAAIVDYLDLATEVGESSLLSPDASLENAVSILTVHSAKGLEFKIVFLVNLVEQRFPTSLRREQIPIPTELVKEILPKGDYHLEEERRLFYVGMTRAKELLYLTAADYYGEGRRTRKVSPFVYEALGEVGSPTASFADDNQLSFFGPSAPAPARAASPFKIDYLSYSQIETFDICPLHYKLKYLVKIPTPTTSAQSFGISIHLALKDFYEAVKNGAKPNKGLITGILDKVWIPEGYQDRQHRQIALKKAQKYLSDFLLHEFNPKILPKYLELPFVVPIINSKSGARLKIGGQIDRVDELPDGSIEIVDYKTGASIPSQKEMDENRQLTFYATALAHLPELFPGRDVEKIALTLYFFDGRVRMSTKRTWKDLERFENEIFKIKDKIETSDFVCSKGYICQSGCEYKLFCL